MWILVSEKQRFRHYNVYSNKILEIKRDSYKEINNNTPIWMIESINGKIQSDYPDWFYEDELEDMDFVEVDEKALNLLVFL